MGAGEAGEVRCPERAPATSRRREPSDKPIPRTSPRPAFPRPVPTDRTAASPTTGKSGAGAALRLSGGNFIAGRPLRRSDRRGKTMEISRNQYFLIGLLVLFAGIQFHMIDTIKLTPQCAQFLAERTGQPAEAAAGQDEPPPAGMAELVAAVRRLGADSAQLGDEEARRLGDGRKCPGGAECSSSSRHQPKVSSWNRARRDAKSIRRLHLSPSPKPKPKLSPPLDTRPKLQLGWA